MKWLSILKYLFVIMYMSAPVTGSAQGSWNPQGSDLSFPRTLLDSTAIPVIRETLSEPEIYSLYQSVWENATATIPDDNSSDGARILRALMAREAAFAVLMERKCESGAISLMTPADRDSLINRSLFLLENMNTNVGFQEGWVFYQEWQHRSKELIGYLIAYDLLRGAGISPDTLRRAHDSLVRFTGNLYHRAMDTYTILIFQFKFFNFQFNNHSIMTASALGLAAIVLNNNENANPNLQPVNWINAGMWNLDNSLWLQGGLYPRVSEPDILAGYAEGPGYFCYAFQNAFPFIRAMGNFLPPGDHSFTFNQVTRQIPNPWHDSRYDYLYQWINKLRQPDGSLPAIHDSPIGFGSTITALSGKPEFNLFNTNYSANDAFIRTQYIATNVAHGLISDSLYQPLPEAGSMVFRSSWEPGALYMHLIGKHGIPLSGAKSHHQGDAGSFSLFAHGQLLAIDPGYPGASLSDVVNKPTDHNLVLVNGNGPNPPNGEFVNTLTNTAYIENYFSSAGLDYGEIRISYGGANIIRKTLFIHKKYFIIDDEITSNLTNNYTFQLHGNGLLGAPSDSITGAFYPDFNQWRGNYQRDSVHLLFMIQDDKSLGSFTAMTDSLATGTSTFRHYTKTMFTRESPGDMLFLTTMYPWIGARPDLAQISTPPGIVAYRISDGTYHDYVFVQTGNSLIETSPGSTGLSETMTGNGKINLYSTHADGSFSSAFLQNGDSLVYGLQPVIRCARSQDFAYEKGSSGIYTGYTSSSGTVELFSDRPLKAVSGPVSAASYDAETNLCLVDFTGKGSFRLEPANGLHEAHKNTGFNISVSPNPAIDGRFTFIVDACTGCKLNLTICDNAGRSIFAQTLFPDARTMYLKIDLSDHPAGIYHLKCTSGSVRQTVNFVKGT
jgi:hypothetical protein